MSPTGTDGSGPGRIAGATVAVADLERAVERYRRYLGLEVIGRGTVADELATHWGAPAVAAAPWALLQPSGGREVPIRLVETGAAAGLRPLRHYGWAALEITIQDADALHEALRDSPFEILGPPRELEITDCFYPMQVAAPDGEVLYLNEIRGSLETVDLPLARSFVDHIFIVVLAAPSLERALAFYETELGYERGNRFEIAYGVLNQAFGFPDDRTHELALTCVGKTATVEVDQFPDEAEPRAVPDGGLPPGIATVALTVESLDRIAVPLRGPVVRIEQPPYNGRRTATCVGTAGEWVEVIEVGG